MPLTIVNIKFPICHHYHENIYIKWPASADLPHCHPCSLCAFVTEDAKQTLHCTVCLGSLKVFIFVENKSQILFNIFILFSHFSFALEDNNFSKQPCLYIFNKPVIDFDIITSDYHSDECLPTHSFITAIY